MIRGILLSWPGVREAASRFGHGTAFVRDGREFAHFHSAREIDLRLTRRVIRTLAPDRRIVKRRAASDWVAFRMSGRADERVACALARIAWSAAKP
jgi:hypothetical protein